MTDLLEPRAIGQALVRRDGEQKVRGTATYAYETPVEHPAFCHPVQATIARGRVTAMDTAAAEALDGVLAVLTPFNAERLASVEDREYAVLQSDEVAFRGQLVGVVVAETSELARQAADAVRITYAEQPHDSALTVDHPDLYAPEKVNAGHPTDTAEGDVDAGVATAAVTVEETYSTAMYFNNPLEPHATTALWDPTGDVPLTLWDSTQGVHPDRSAVCEVFGLEGRPERIEVYDNSHIMGTSAVGGMIVAGPEGFAKNQYRKFNIKGSELTPGDDYGMMREVLRRRFSRLVKEEEEGEPVPRPDLVLIDGGAGQLAVAREVLVNLGLHDIVVAGVAKGPDRDAGLERFFIPGRDPFMLDPKSPVLYYLQRLRDEAHRFAIGTHRAKRAKSLTTSTLDEVPGIGPNRKRALLMHFGTGRAVKNAALEDLEKAPGISRTMARSIYDYFHPSG